MIKVLSDREHILKRPGMYIGAVSYVEKEGFFLNEEDKFEYKRIKYIPGLLKIIDEIIDNSVDEAIRTNFKYADKIKVNISENDLGEYIEIIDNGRGIPVKLNEEVNKYMPLIAFGQARAGSNFDDTNRTTIGTHGIGSYATNVFSKKFIGEVCDINGNYYKVEFINNAESYKEKVKLNKGCKNHGTKVRFYIDYEKFKIKKLDKTHLNLIKQRLMFLSLTYPEISFYFNKTKINLSNKKFLELINENFEIFESKNYFIGLSPNNLDDFNYITTVNGIWLSGGGNHINWSINRIVNELREKLKKKFKNIKPGDIKNKLTLVVIARNFPNPQFDSQTKERLTNSDKEISEFFKDFQDNIDKFALKIYRNKEIIENIILKYKIQQEFEERKKLAQIEKKLKKNNYPEKYVAPIIEDIENNILYITEGLSAISQLLSVRDEYDAGYPLRGKFINVLKASDKKVLENQEVQDLLKITGLKMSSPDISNFRFKEIRILTDMDEDGNQIFGLLLVFFYKYWPDLFKQNKIKRVLSPLIKVKDLEANKILKFYSLSEYENYVRNVNDNIKVIEYNKGLGALEKEEYKEMINNPVLVDVKYIDSSDDENIKIAFSEDSNLRKIWLKD